jgi:hypothetical protein
MLSGKRRRNDRMIKYVGLPKEIGEEYFPPSNHVDGW